MPYSYAPVDIVFLLILLFFVITAASRGLIKEFFGKAAFVAGIVAAVLCTPLLEPFVRDGIPNALLAKVVSFLLIFIIAFLVVKIVQEIVSRIFSGEILQGLDRALGFVFGIVEGFAVISLIIVAFKVQPWFDTRLLFDSSIFYRLLDGIIRVSETKLQELPA